MPELEPPVALAPAAPAGLLPEPAVLAPPVLAPAEFAPAMFPLPALAPLLPASALLPPPAHVPDEPPDVPGESVLLHAKIEMPASMEMARSEVLLIMWSHSLLRARVALRCSLRRDPRHVGT